MWTRESLGVSGGQGMWWLGSAGIKACGDGSRWGSNHGQSMWNGSHWASAGVKACSGCQRGSHEWLGVRGGSNHVDTGVAGGQQGSNHVDTGVAAGQRGSNHVDTGVAGGQRGQIMWTRESLGVSGGQIMLTRESLSGGQIMWTREWLGVSGGQIMWWLGSAGVKSC